MLLTKQGFLVAPFPLLRATFEQCLHIAKLDLGRDVYRDEAISGQEFGFASELLDLLLCLLWICPLMTQNTDERVSGMPHRCLIPEHTLLLCRFNDVTKGSRR